MLMTDGIFNITFVHQHPVSHFNFWQWMASWNYRLFRQYDISRKSFNRKNTAIIKHFTLAGDNLESSDFAALYQTIMIYTPDILRPSHDVKKYFFGSQKLLQFCILEDAVFSPSFLYSLEHFWALWRHHFWWMTPKSSTSISRMTPSSSTSNVRNFWWKSFFEKLIPFFYIWLNVKINLSFFEKR